MATFGLQTSPEVLSAASRCPYIQQVVADVGDPQTVSNSLAPFLTLATVTTGTRGTSAAPQQRPAAAATTSVATDAAPAASTEADAASPAAAVAGTPSDTEEVVSAEDKA